MTIEELAKQYTRDVLRAVQSERARNRAHESSSPKERLALAIAYHRDMAAATATELALFEAVEASESDR